MLVYVCLYIFMTILFFFVYSWLLYSFPYFLIFSFISLRQWWNTPFSRINRSQDTLFISLALDLFNRFLNTNIGCYVILGDDTNTPPRHICTTKFSQFPSSISIHISFVYRNIFEEAQVLCNEYESGSIMLVCKPFST